SDGVEQLLDGVLVLDLRDRLTTSVQVAALAECDKLLDDRADFLRLRQRGYDLLMGDERGSHVGEHRLAVACGTIKFAACFCVAHLWSPSLADIRLQSDPVSIGLRNAWRGLRCVPAARRELPCRDGGPWTRELP